jgi:broad specificity phosphatase PhoE
MTRQGTVWRLPCAKVDYTITMPPQFSTDLLLFLVVFFCVLVALRMRPRRFYFIRHGETILNAQHIRQGEEGELSETGREQARKVAQYFKKRRIKLIISSTYERAKETAEIIKTELQVPILYSKILVERRNPSEIIGKNRDLPEVAHIIDQMDLAYHPDEYRYSDEEIFIELKRRAQKCVDLLARQGLNGTVVITHHVFLKIFLAYLLYREDIHAKDFVKLSFFNISDNAAITICTFNPWKSFTKTRGWSIVSYNEQPGE